MGSKDWMQSKSLSLAIYETRHLAAEEKACFPEQKIIDFIKINL